MADSDTRRRLYDEYRGLADKLRPCAATAENSRDLRRLWELGEQLEAKLHELQEASRVRRSTPRPDSGF